MPCIPIDVEPFLSKIVYQYFSSFLLGGSLCSSAPASVRTISGWAMQNTAKNCWPPPFGWPLSTIMRSVIWGPGSQWIEIISLSLILRLLPMWWGVDLLRLVYDARMLQGLKNGLRWFDLLGYLYFEIMDELFRDDLSDKTTALLTLGTVIFVRNFELFIRSLPH